MKKIHQFAPTVWRDYRLDWGSKTYIMGIVNVTPDSFSGDGLAHSDDPQDWVAMAVTQAQQQVTDGADIIDVGGASSRPGAINITVAEEIARVVPAITALAKSLPSNIPISIDTTSVVTAQAAVAAGASIINDISGLYAKPDLAHVATAAGIPLIIMANRRNVPHYSVLSDIIRYLSRAIDSALATGVPWEHIIIDPGFGFGNSPGENLAILNHFDALQGLERPILLGVSRKSTLGVVLGDVAPDQRLEASLAAATVGVMHGANLVRVHDVAPTARAMKVADAIRRA